MVWSGMAGRGQLKTSVPKPTGGAGQQEREYRLEWESRRGLGTGRERVGIREKSAYIRTSPTRCEMCMFDPSTE